MPELAIIMPTIEIESKLLEAIASLETNDCARNVELIVVVDGPRTDVDPGLRFLSKPIRILHTGRRMGSAAASNIGASSTDAGLIGRMDSDDRSVAGRLDRSIAYLESHPNVAACGGTGPLIDENGHNIGSHPGVPVGDVRHTLVRRDPIVHSSLVMRRAAFEAIGGYDQSMLRMQDYDLLLRASLGGEIHAIGDDLVEYRIHAGQTSRQLANFGHTMRTILRGRQQLSAHLGGSVCAQTTHDVTYFLAQIARYAGLRRPRYERGINKPAEAERA